MYPPKFDYYRAGSVQEAIALLGQHEDAKILAGGHSLIPTMNIRLADPGVVERLVEDHRSAVLLAGATA